MQIYYSENCPNCTRLLHIEKKIASLQGSELIDVDRTHPGHRVGIEYVPTIVDGNRRYVGTEVFDFMKSFEQELDLEPAPEFTGNSLYSSIDDDGAESTYVAGYGDF